MQSTYKLNNLYLYLTRALKGYIAENCLTFWENLARLNGVGQGAMDYHPGDLMQQFILDNILALRKGCYTSLISFQSEQFSYLKKKNKQKIRFIWLKSDFLFVCLFFSFFTSINFLIQIQFFIFFSYRPLHLTPLEVNQSSSVQCLRVANFNYAMKKKTITNLLSNEKTDDSAW